MGVTAPPVRKRHLDVETGPLQAGRPSHHSGLTGDRPDRLDPRIPGVVVQALVLGQDVPHSEDDPSLPHRSTAGGGHAGTPILTGCTYVLHHM